MVRNMVAFERQDITALSTEREIEVAAIEIRNINVIIVALYRPPSGNIAIFWDKLNEVLLLLSNDKTSKNLFIAGDFNLDFSVRNKNTESITDLFKSFNLKIAFHEPSRVTANSSTLIDNIFTNTDLRNCCTNTTNLHLSDHLAQLLTSRISTQPASVSRVGSVRSFSLQGIDLFRGHIRSINLPENDDAAVLFSCFHNTFMDLFRRCFPERNINTKRGYDPLEINDEILNMRNSLDAWACAAKVTKSRAIYEQYRELKKQYLQAITNNKQERNTRYIENADNKVKAIWNVINSSTRSGNPKFGTSALTADGINRYFGTVGERTAGGIHSEDLPYEYMRALSLDNTHSFFFRPITPDEIIRVSVGLKGKETKDVYGVSTNLLKRVARELSKPLSYIFNRCVTQGVFPGELKVAKVLPVFKKGNANECENYRPISILPAISKIFEQSIAVRLYEYLEQNNYLSSKQHGYRKGHSISTGVVDYIYNAFDNRRYAEMTMLDLSKAFDSVSPDILVEKLGYYGVRGSVLDLLKSYLSERTQTTKWNDALSQVLGIRYGVPQGSILGPLLFIIFINDLPFNIRNAGMCLYADDTSILVQDAELDGLRRRSEQATESANRWFAANKLKVNVDKTQSLLFTARRGNERLEARFLGLTLDTYLGWSEHIHSLANKLTSALFAIRRLTQVATHLAAKTAYFSIFHSHLCYGIVFWGLASDASRIFVLQKQAVRSLCSLKYNESCRSYFRRERILTLVSQFIHATICFVHLNVDQFIENGSTHDYDTRQRNNLQTPYHRLTCSQHSMRYWGAKLYNKLPLEYKSLQYSRFKVKVKKLLVELECYDVGEYLDRDLRR